MGTARANMVGNEFGDFKRTKFGNPALEVEVIVIKLEFLDSAYPDSQESFLGIRGNSHESFTGKSSENVDSFSQKFLVTHSEKILVTLSNEFLVTNSREFLFTNSSEKPEKICSKKVFRTNSWEFPWNYSQDFLKNSSGISWNIH